MAENKVRVIWIERTLCSENPGKGWTIAKTIFSKLERTYPISQNSEWYISYIESLRKEFNIWSYKSSGILQKSIKEIIESYWFLDNSVEWNGKQEEFAWVLESIESDLKHYTTDIEKITKVINIMGKMMLLKNTITTAVSKKAQDCIFIALDEQDNFPSQEKIIKKKK